MTANKRTFEVDRFLTRELLLRNPDNSVPAPNQAILTDGKGGVYYGHVDGGNSAGFNRITLPDTNQYVQADLSFNNLNFREGFGIQIAKLNTDTLVFQATIPQLSTYSMISTHTGTLMADNISSVLEISSGYGILIDTSSNKLSISGLPAYNTLIVSTISGADIAVATASQTDIILQAGTGISLDLNNNSVTIANSAIPDPAYNNIHVVTDNTGTIHQSSIANNLVSTLGFNAGFGITLDLAEDNTVTVSNNFGGYAINAVATDDGNIMAFPLPYNQVAINGEGNITTSGDGATVVVTSYSFNSISTPGTYFSAYNGPELLFSQGYGLKWSNEGGATRLDVSVPSSFQYISTANGIIDAPYSTNTLTLEGQGINIYVTDRQKLHLSIASTFARTITINGISTIADATDTLNLGTLDGSIVAANADDGSILLGTTNFSVIDISGGQPLYSNNPSAFGTFKLAGAPGTKITGDPNTNTITIAAISTIGIPIVQTAFSQINIYSSVTSFIQDLNGYTYVQIDSYPSIQASLNIVGVSPLLISTNTARSKPVIYMGLNQSTLFAPLNNDISQVNDNIVILQEELSNLGDAVNTSNIQTLDISISSLHLGGSLVFSSDTSNNILLNTGNLTASTISADMFNVVIFATSSLATSTATVNTVFGSTIITNTISSLFAQTNVLSLSTIALTRTSLPLMSFDYINKRVGINTGAIPPQADLDVIGTILAHNHVTYSDPSLKKFTIPFTVSDADLENLQPWRFKWLIDGTEDIGISATAVEKVIPELVKIGQSGLKMVDYGRLSVVSLAALMETNKRVAILESTVAGLSKFDRNYKNILGIWVCDSMEELQVMEHELKEMRYARSCTPS